MKKTLKVIFIAVLFLSCGGDSPTKPTPVDCDGTAIVAVSNVFGEDAKVFLDGNFSVLLQSGERKELTVTSDVTHELEVCLVPRRRGCCTWTVNLPACGEKLFICSLS